MMFDAAVVSEIGRRAYMEDAYYLQFADEGKQLFCGIYDGHGGDAAAIYARDNLHKLFFKVLTQGENEASAFVQAFETISKELSHQDSGTTAVSFYIKNKTVFLANAGDARLIVIGRSQAKQLTQDHRLTNPQEYQRLLKAGGVVQPPYVYKYGQGLMPTRTIGDEYFKDIGIIATPQTDDYQLTSQDRWIVAGSDGLFDELTNEEIVRLLLASTTAKQAAEVLKKEVLVTRQGRDNLTFIVLKIKD